MTEEIKYCETCGIETLHSWIYDQDSEPNEPQFTQVCLVCGKITQP